MAEYQPSAPIFLNKQEFKLFKEEIFLPELEDEISSCKPDPEGYYCLELTFDQLDELHMQASFLVDDAPTKKQRELWDGIWIQLGNALDEAAMEAEEGEVESCGNCSGCNCAEEE